MDKQCNLENFLSANVLRKFKEDNVKLTAFLKQESGSSRVGKGKTKIWKPDKVHLTKID